MTVRQGRTTDSPGRNRPPTARARKQPDRCLPHWLHDPATRRTGHRSRRNREDSARRPRRSGTGPRDRSRRLQRRRRPHRPQACRGRDSRPPRQRRSVGGLLQSDLVRLLVLPGALGADVSGSGSGRRRIREEPCREEPGAPDAPCTAVAVPGAENQVCKSAGQGR